MINLFRIILFLTLFLVACSEQKTTESPNSNCDPSYLPKCIKSPPPDLDCKDIPYRRFKVLPPDPHGFDADKDGIGCEID